MKKSKKRMLSVAYRPSDDMLQVATEIEVLGDAVSIGRGVHLVIALDDGRPIGVLVQGFYGHGWRVKIDQLAHYIAAHLEDVREEAIAEGIYAAVSQVGSNKPAASAAVLHS